MAMSTKLKTIISQSSRIDLASYMFYFIGGIILLVFFPLTSFAPHVLLLGILGVVTGYFLFKKRKETMLLIFVYFITASVFSIYTVVVGGFGNYVVAGLLVAYAILTWVFTIYLGLFKGTKA
ncbi:MAG: hypothetical protein NWF01_04370 [Candidatus Bathyarchaeota archaeon]|nr:hypothetical protein [Candidatus Bathyarchaeota archaeon]